jgi:hypothetical protein
VIPAHSMPVSCQEKILTSLSYTPDGKHIFFSTNDGVVAALETESNTPVGSWMLGLGEIDFIRARHLSLLIVGDGELVWSFGHNDGTLLEQSSFVRVDGCARAVCIDENDDDKVWTNIHRHAHAPHCTCLRMYLRMYDINCHRF